MKILETERLLLREIDSATDAEFIFELLNSPKFKRYIGDRGVRSPEQARGIIEDSYRASYREHGFGLYAVETRLQAQNGELLIRQFPAGTPVGMCGFVKRDMLPDPDVGFAFLPQFERNGYGFESASAVLQYGRDHLGFTKVLAITSQDNKVSIKLLQKLGFKFERIHASPDGEYLNLFEKLL